MLKTTLYTALICAFTAFLSFGAQGLPRDPGATVPPFIAAEHLAGIASAPASEAVENGSTSGPQIVDNSFSSIIPPQPPTFSFTKIVDTIGVIEPAREGNTIAFPEGVGTTGINGIFKLDNTGLRLTIADDQTTVPGTEKQFNRLDSSPLDLQNGYVYFSGGAAGGGVFEGGIYKGNGVNPLDIIVDTDTAIPGEPFRDFLSASQPSVDGTKVAFIGSIRFFGNTPSNGLFVYDETTGSIETIAKSESPPPEINGDFVIYSFPMIEGNNVVFMTQHDNFNFRLPTDIYLYRNNTFELVVSPDTLIPPGNVGNFTYLRPQQPVIDNGAVYFIGGNDIRQGIYKYANGVLSVVYDTNLTVPGASEKFREFRDVAISDGDIVFYGVSEVANDFSGLGLYTNLGGELRKLVERGDMLEGGIVHHVVIGRHPIDRNSIIFGIQHREVGEEVTYAIYRADLSLSPEILDAIDFRTGSSITTNYEALARGGRAMAGVTTDGEARLLVRLTAPESGTATFTLEGTGVANEDGGLRHIEGGSFDHTVTADTVYVQGEGHKAFALYRAPEGFVRQHFPEDKGAVQRTVKLHVEFTPASNPGSPMALDTSLQLVRPPVVLVHGWHSGPETWDDFAQELSMALPDIRLYKVDYRETNNSAFVFNSWVPIADLTKARRELRRSGIAMVQADVFGHSMGGLLARILAGRDDYESDSTYEAGYINKLITIDSPHFGVLWADCWQDLGPLIRAIIAKATGIVIPDEYGAIDDLSTRSHAIAELNDTPTDVPSYSIIGNYPLSTDLTTLPDPWGKLWKTLTYIPLCIGPITDFFNSAHDIIVPVSSQAGGLPSQATKMFGHVHWNFNDGLPGATEKENLLIHPKAIELLNTPADVSSTFAEGFRTGLLKSSMLEERQADLELRRQSLATATGGITVIAPATGAILSPGQNVTVTVAATNGVVLQSVMVISAGFAEELTAAPFTTTLTIPEEAVGPETIMIMGKDLADTLYTTQVTVNVIPETTLESLKVEPSAIELADIGMHYQLSVTGQYTDGFIRNLTHSATETTYASSDPAVVTVDANGMLAAQDNGVATVTVTNGERFYPVIVTVAAETDLALTLSPSADPVTPSENLTYTVTVINSGTTKAHNILLFAPLPPELENPEYSLDGGTTWLSWAGNMHLGDLPAGGSQEILMRSTVSATASGVLSVTARVTAAAADPNANNNIANKLIQVQLIGDIIFTDSFE